jgi:inorganic pyrophosphatase
MDLLELPPVGEDGGHRFIVESPRGSSLKLKYEPTLGAFTVSRPLGLGLVYPFDWGFFPGTRGPDGDPIDGMLLADFSTPPGTVVPCRVIGMLELDQKKKGGGGRERNDRLLAVPQSAPRFGPLEDVNQLPARFRDELARFFVNATAFEDKDPHIIGWAAPEAAKALIERSKRR